MVEEKEEGQELIMEKLVMTSGLFCWLRPAAVARVLPWVVCCMLALVRAKLAAVKLGREGSLAAVLWLKTHVRGAAIQERCLELVRGLQHGFFVCLRILIGWILWWCTNMGPTRGMGKAYCRLGTAPAATGLLMQVDHHL